MGEQQTGREDAAAAARCTTCGAVPTPAPASASPGAEGAEAATETHCEWCGAEYPVPGAA